MSEDFALSSARFWVESYLTGSGSAFVDELEAGFKQRAKSLQRALADQAPNPRLTQVQESLANALGFANVHALQQVLNDTRRGLAPDGARARIEWINQHKTLVDALAPVHALMPSFAGDTPLADVHVCFLESLAGKLSRRLGFEVRPAMARAWAGEATWEALTTRNPVSKGVTGPLVSFIVEGDPASRSSKGRFEITEAGHWIWDHVLGSDPDEGPPSDTVTWTQKYRLAMEYVDRHPELLVGWSTVVDLLERQDEERNWSRMISYCERGLKAAEQLMPKGFKGRLNWGHLDNRPYLRALYQLMSMYARSTNGMAPALRAATKYVRLCPQQSLSVECLMPIMMALEKGDTLATRRAVARVARGEYASPSGQLNGALALLLLGDPSGMALFIESILRVPEFGAVLLEDERVRPIRGCRRPIGYEDPWSETIVVQTAMSRVPPLRDLVAGVLSDEALLHEEERLAAIVEDESANRWGQWDEEVPALSSVMATTLLGRFPLTALRGNARTTAPSSA